MISRPYYCWFACLDSTAAAWMCGVVDQISGEPIALPPTQRLAELVPIDSPAISIATAWCGGIAFGDETRLMLLALENAGQLPSGLVYILCDQTDPERYEIIRTNHPAGAAVIGLQWTGESTSQALAILGLQRRVSE